MTGDPALKQPLGDSAKKASAFDDLYRFAKTSLIGVEGRLVSEQMRGILKAQAEKALSEADCWVAMSPIAPGRMGTLCIALIHTVLAVCAYPDHQQPVTAMRELVTLIGIYRDPQPGAETDSARWETRADLMG